MSVCPKCGKKMEQGFYLRTSGLWYVRPEKLRRFVFKCEDLVKSGFRKILPSRAEYYLAFLCEECKFFAVDFSKSLNTAEAKKLAAAK